MYKTIDEIPEDLKWLAENVHEWPTFDNGAPCHEIYKCHLSPEGYGRQFDEDARDGTEYTRSQWQAARDLISGKPGRDEAPGPIQRPKGATHKGLDGNYYHERDDEQYLVWNPKVNLWMFSPAANSGRVYLVELEIQYSPTEDSDMVDRTERSATGGIPPRGELCESRLVGAGYREGRIVYASGQLIVWRDESSGDEVATRPKDREFRPIRSTRDRWVDEAE